MSAAASFTPRLDALSDAAVEFATDRDLDVAAAELVDLADSDRTLLEAVHARHGRRMAGQSSDDYGFTRGLHVIESALRRIPRHGGPLFRVHSFG